jgi:nicotinate-nucleotide adenylyltransferase
MKIGLLFGSFNPIHTGHLIIANHIASYHVDKIWFIVSPQNPFKRSAELLNAECRFALAKLAIENDNRFEALDIEFHLPTPSYTIDTLQTITAKYPEHKFYLIMGSDNFLNISKWKASTEIVNNYNLLVYQRTGFTVDEECLAHNITLLNAPLLDISSTTIRNLIAQNKSIRYLVPEKVYKEIQANGYYR